ncbi:MAG: hypothetical protein JSW71_17485 [Gemmatimonadota bacterium]|nr:MAG: hypothetical protein JSW71_17485 [Gemmatimonadota bacterium]
MRSLACVALPLAVALAPATEMVAQPQHFDVLILGGHALDGTGTYGSAPISASPAIGSSPSAG